MLMQTEVKAKVTTQSFTRMGVSVGGTIRKSGTISCHHGGFIRSSEPLPSAFVERLLKYVGKKWIPASGWSVARSRRTGHVSTSNLACSLPSSPIGI